LMPPCPVTVLSSRPFAQELSFDSRLVMARLIQQQTDVLNELRVVLDLPAEFPTTGLPLAVEERLAAVAAVLGPFCTGAES
jgi:hypothetical protein